MDTEGRKRTDAVDALMEDAMAEAEASGSGVIVSWVRERDSARDWSSVW